MLVCVSDFSTSFPSLTPASTSPWARTNLFCDEDNVCEKERTSTQRSRSNGSRNRIDDGIFIKKKFFFPVSDFLEKKKSSNNNSAEVGDDCKKDKDCKS